MIKGKTLHIKFLLLVLFCCQLTSSLAQNVSINLDGAEPDTSAMLDVVSINKGLLIPRMTETQRDAIAGPATGLIIFQTDGTSGFYFNAGTPAAPSWIKLNTTADASSSIADADGNTQIQVEESTNEDIIRMDIAGLEVLRIHPDGRMHTVNTKNSVYLGSQSGAAVTSGTQNAFLGHEAGGFNSSGGSNTFIGYRAGYVNTTTSRNTFVGALSGDANNGGNDNTFMGVQSGTAVNTGSHNTVIGKNAGRIFTTGNNNTFLGINAGEVVSTSSSGNVFLGAYAASTLSSANDLLYIENSTSTTPLIWGDFANDSIKIYGTLSIGDSTTFPTNRGSNGQVLTSDGAGGISWQSASGSGSFTLDVDTLSAGSGNQKFVFGSTNTDSLNGTADDNRMFFDISDATFRAGTASGTQWDAANRGNGSVALGNNTTASGNYAFAAGDGTSALGARSIAMGRNSTAGASRSIAMGASSYAGAAHAVAIGELDTAMGTNSIAIGRNANAQNDNGVAIGTDAVAQGLESYAIGQDVIAESMGEIVLGHRNATLGSGFSTTSRDATDRLLVIGNSTNGIDRSNALVMLKNGNTTLSGELTVDDLFVPSGNVGIGTSTPSRPLHIHNDGIGEYIQSKTSNFSAYTEYGNLDATFRGLIGSDGTNFSGTADQMSIATWTNHPIKFFTNQVERMAITSSGNVGIGLENPSVPLEIKATTTVLDNPGPLSISSSSIHQYTEGIRITSDSLDSGDDLSIAIGKEGSTNNIGWIGYRYVGDGLDSNALVFNLWNRKRILNITGQRRVGINTLTPEKDLDVNGAATIDTLNINSVYTFPTDAPAATEVLRYNGTELEWGTVSSASVWATSGSIAYYNTGDVGIGTSTPAANLDVTAPGPADANNAQFRVTNSTTGDKMLIGRTADYGFIQNHDLEPLILNPLSNNVGIGITTPHAPLQFATTVANRKIVLYEGVDNDHQFYGFGVQSNEMRYQTDGTISDHVFYAATSSTTSDELMRIAGDGNVGINTSTPDEKLHIQGNQSNLIFTGGSPHSVMSHGDLILDIDENANSTGEQLIIRSDSTTTLMVVEEEGDVGIGTTTPTALLSIHSTGHTGVPGIFLDGFSTSEGDITWDSGEDLQLGEWNGSALTQHAVIQNTTGYLGLGVNSPGYKLHIRGSSTSEVNAGIENQDGSGYSILRFRNDAGNETVLFHNGSTRSADGGTGSSTLRNDGTGDLILTSSSADLVLQPNGRNVGIGTATPSQLLHLTSNTSGDANLLIEADTDNNNESDNPSIVFEQDGAAVTGRVGLTGLLGETYTNSLANAIHMGTDGAFDLQLYTNAAARMTIQEDGDVGIGTNTPTTDLHVEGNQINEIIRVQNNSTDSDADGIGVYLGATTPGASNGWLFFYGNGVTMGSVAGNGAGGTSFTTTSDRRLKTNIKDMSNALGMISQMQPRVYNRILNPTNLEYGFIAQELQKVYPQAVSGTPDGDPHTSPMGVDYGQLTPVLVKAIQELNERIELIEKENTANKKEIEGLKADREITKALEARIEELEKQLKERK